MALPENSKAMVGCGNPSPGGKNIGVVMALKASKIFCRRSIGRTGYKFIEKLLALCLGASPW